MAARYFIPQDGDWAWDGAVWASSSTGAAGSAATPVTGDDVYIVTGRANITSSLNQSAVNLASLHIGFAGTIGSSASSLRIGLGDTYDAFIYGSGTLYLTIVQAVADSWVTVYDTFSGNLTLSNSSLTSILCGTTGTLVINGGTATTVVTCGCSILTDSSFTVATDFSVYGGNHVLACSISGGQLYIAGKSAYVTFSGVCPDDTNVVSGTYVHDSSRTIPSITVRPTGRAEVGPNAGPFTVSTSELFAGGSLFERHGNNITYSVATTKTAIR
jgi:hypothetical protein